MESLDTVLVPPIATGTALPHRGRLPQAASFAGVTLLFGALFVAASAPSPLFVVFQKNWGFPTWMLTLAFAVYAIALLAALLSLGSLSDHIGRRPVIVGALLLEALSMAVFVVATDITGIIVARILQGLATGAATGALTAAMVELAPERHRKLGTLLVGIAPLLGLALGAGATGVVVQLSATPSLMVFPTLGVLFLLGIAVVLLSPETVSPRRGAWRSLMPTISVPPQARGEFAASVPVHIATWMLGGFSLGLVPSVVRGVFHLDSGLLNGVTIGILAGSGALAVSAFPKVPARRTTIVGTSAMVGGTLLLIAAIFAGWFPLFVTGTIVAGAGFGLSFSGALRLIVPLVQAHQRAELFAAIYVVSYLANGVPAILAGILIGGVGLRSTVDAYVVVVLGAAVIGMFAQLAAARRLAGRQVSGRGRVRRTAGRGRSALPVRCRALADGDADGVAGFCAGAGGR